MIFKILFVLSYALAEEQRCEKIKTYHQFYHCSVTKHPLFAVSKLKKQEGEALLGRASQWKNPEVELKSLGGENGGEKVGSTEISVSVPISQLWVRGAAKDVGRAEKKIAEIASQESLMAVQREILKSLYRLRQTEDELDFVSEAIGSFEKIQGQFRGRSARGPEQEITLNLVELAVGDYELKKNHLTKEKAEISAGLKSIWGPQFLISNELLPPLKEKWPEIKEDLSMAQSFETRKLFAESELASAEESLANSESWPELKAGPSIERTTVGPNQFLSYGFNVSMTVPIFSFNGGARNLAEAKAGQSKVLSEYAQKKSMLERDILVLKYRSAVESLKKSANRDALKKKHSKIDSLTRQGLISGGSIIEAHRQILEYMQAQHEHELEALNSLIEIKTLSGNDIEEILQ